MLAKIEARVNRWFMQPESNAAGRLGICRVLFALFGLWNFLSHTTDKSHIDAVPDAGWYPVFVVEWMSQPPPSAWLEIALGVVIFSLIWLMFGFLTRLATLTFMI